MLIAAAILVMFVYGLIASMLGTILPEFSERLRLTPRQDGNLALVQAAGLAAASIAAGPFMDAEGKKAGLLLGLALSAAALAWLPKAAGYRTLLGAFALLGFGGGFVVTGANFLAGSIDAARRASMLNLVNVFYGVGGMATPLLAADVLKGNSRRLCHAVAGAAAVVFALHAATPMPGAAGGLHAADIARLAGRPALWLFALMLFLYVAVEVGVWNWLARHLTAQGIAEKRALQILSLGFALGLLGGRAGVSRLLVTAGPRGVVLTASVLTAVTTWIALRARRPAVAWAAVFSAGLAMAPVYPTTLAMLEGAFPVMTATAMGVAITSGFIGLAFSSRLIGAISGEDPKRLESALLVLPAASVIMVVIAALLRVG
jgi:fucose permease